MGDAAWDETRVRLRDAILAAVGAQLEVGRSGKVIARRLDRISKLLRMAERQAELPEEHGWAAGDLEEFMEPHIVALRDLAANDRPPSRLLDLASTRRWLTSYIAKFRKEHPAATAKEWRGLPARAGLERGAQPDGPTRRGHTG